MHDRMPVLPQTGVRAFHYPENNQLSIIQLKKRKFRIAGIDVRGCRLLHITEKAAPHNTLKRRAESEKPEKTRLATSLV